MKFKRGEIASGLSLVEVLIVISVLGIAGALAMNRTSSIRDNVRQTKLEQDVKHLNNAVRVYLANGGSFDGVTSAQGVIDRMKAGMSATSQDSFVGITGATVDKRLAARTDKGMVEKVAIWSSDDQSFRISDYEEGGVTEFYFDEALGMKTYEPIERVQSVVSYGEDSGWIWDFAERSAQAADGTTEIATSEVADSAPPALPVRLSPPLIGTASGAYPSTFFPTQLTISNYNDPSTWLMVSLNGDPFFRYENPITLSGPGSVIVFATGDPEFWRDSDDVSAFFTELPPTPPAQLSPPIIDLSASKFDETTTEITITLSNPNATGTSSVLYSVVAQGNAHPDPLSWITNTGSVVADVSGFPDGFSVAAFAQSVDSDRFIDSANATAFTTSDFFEIPVTANVLFIVDASGSMTSSFESTSRFERTIQELTQSIQSLPNNLKFNVGMFDADVHWTDGSFRLLPANTNNKNSLISQIQSLDNGSGTNYAAGLGLVSQFDPVPDQVIFLSDGEPNSTPYDDILNDLAAAGVRIDAIGLDLDNSATAVLEEIVDLTGGTLKSLEDSSGGGDDDDD